MLKTKTFQGANVFMSRNLVPPEVFDALHDAVKDNGAQIHLCCDPSRNGPNDYHIISCSEHEKFEDLKSKGCKMLGPRCVLECAKEGRPLPEQGFTCCHAMDGVKVLASGFDADEKIKIEELVTGMGGALNTEASPDLNFVVVKNFLAADDMYKWALDILQKPMVSDEWLKQCSDQHRVVPHESYKVLPFSGLKICAKRIPEDKREEIQTLTLQNGGEYSAELTRECTHLISDDPENDKDKVEKRWGHIDIVTKEWFDQSIARRDWQSLVKDTVSQLATQAVQMISEMPSQFPSQPQNSRNTANDHVGSGVDNHETDSSILSPAKKMRLMEEPGLCSKVPATVNTGIHVYGSNSSEDNMLKDAGEVTHPPVLDFAASIDDLIEKTSKMRDQRSLASPGCAGRIYSSDCSILGEDNPNPNPPTVFGLSKYWLNSCRKDDEGNSSRNAPETNSPTDSLTDSESQVVTYQEDFSGMQKLKDRIQNREHLND